MGTLKPGATYIYERDANRIYAREMGQTEKRLVGWTDSSGLAMQEYRSEMNQVLAMCETDPVMRDLLDQLFVLYNLKKQHNDDVMWHPV
jgi:hypothetical protein